MVEVFKTSVGNREDAEMLLDLIHRTFSDYNANFDLEDCDRILRVKTTVKWIKSSLIINLLGSLGFYAEILPDEKPSTVQMMLFEKKFYPVHE